MAKEHEKLEARREASSAMAKMPYRFFVKAGESKEIVIIDEGITFARNEHALKNPRTGRFDLFLPCIAEHANCPVCAEHSDKQPYFAAFLTILDLEEYEDRDGNTRYFSKRLLEIKPMQQKKFMRLQQQHGSLRGMVLTMTRDSAKDARIGNDIEFSGEVMDEETLAQYEYSYVDRNDKEVTVIGSEPFDYEELFPDLSEKQLRAIVNGKPEPGSRAYEQEEMGGGDGFDDDEEQQAPARRPARGAAPARQAAPQRQQAPQRAHTRPARQEEPEETEEEAEEQEQAAPARRPVAGTRAATRSALRRPAAAPAEEEEEQEEAPPPRSIAGARQALRRNR